MINIAHARAQGTETNGLSSPMRLWSGMWKGHISTYAHQPPDQGLEQAAVFHRGSSGLLGSVEAASA